jgi:hypothetical protein
MPSRRGGLALGAGVATQNSRIPLFIQTQQAPAPAQPRMLPAGLGHFRARSLQQPGAGGIEMLYTLAVILLIAWLLGVVGTYTVGAFIHVLLVVAIVLFLVGLLSGRRTVV